MSPSLSRLVDFGAVDDSRSPLTRADVEHVARLARLALSDAEVESLTSELASILEHAASVSALDTADVPPTSHPLPLRNVLRPDEAHQGLDRSDVLAQAPATDDNRFRVPRIFGEAP